MTTNRSTLLMLALLVLGLCAEPAIAYEAERLLNLTAADGDEYSEFRILPPRTENLYCSMTITNFAGTGNAQLQVHGCTPDKITTRSCTDGTDADMWYASAALTADGTTTMLVSEVALVGDSLSPGAERNGPLPPIWQVKANEAGGNWTADVIIDCIWW